MVSPSRTAARPAARSAPSPAASAPPSAVADRAGSSGRGILFGAVAVLLLLAGGGVWWFVLRPVPVPVPTPPARHLPARVTKPVIAPVAKPVVAPVPVPATPGQVAARLRAAINATDCTLAHPEPGTTEVTVRGFAGDSVASMLQERASALAGNVALAWRVQDLKPVFCQALTMLRDVTPLAGAPDLGLGLRLAGGVSALRDGARIEPRITMANFAGYVRVDYLGHDGSIVHLYPTVADPSQHFRAVPGRRLAAGALVRLGDGAPGQPLWEVGPPYGTDMIIAVASARPLLPADPPVNVDVSAAAYLQRLAQAIAAARADGEQVTATVLPVDTLPAQK